MKSNGAWLPTDIRTKIKTEAIANEDITELSTRINDHKSTLNTTAHLISNISGLQDALDGKVDDAQVLTNVPSGALFTDTVYTHPTNHAISVVTGLQSALDGKLTGNGVTGSIEVVTSVDFAGETVTTATISYSDGLITGVV